MRAKMKKEDTGFKVEFQESERCTNYLDYLNIPWWGSEQGDGKAFKAGRVTSFMGFKHKKENFIIIWWNRPQPTKTEIIQKIKEEGLLD